MCKELENSDMSRIDTDNMSGYKRGSEDSGCEQSDKQGRWESEGEPSDDEQVAIYTFKAGEFIGKSVRVSKTRPPMTSAIDIIMAVNDCTPKMAQNTWNYQKTQAWAVADPVSHWQFPGERQRETPVLTAQQVVKLIAQTLNDLNHFYPVGISGA